MNTLDDLSLKKSMCWVVGLLWVTSFNVHATLAIPGLVENRISPLAITDKTLAKTGLSVNEDDVLDDQDANKLTLNESQLHEARVWGLSVDEEKRYIHLMQNRSGLYFKGLRQTPLDILGINARSEAERNQLAVRASAQEAQKVSKSIAWNNAFHVAYNALFEGVPVVGEFDKTPFAPANYKPITLQSHDVLYLFITPKQAIKTVLMTLTDAIDATPAAQLNVMMLDADDMSIQLWANTHQLSRNLVTDGRINLNHGERHFEALALKNKTTPLLLLVRDGVSRVVDLGRF